MVLRGMQRQQYHRSLAMLLVMWLAVIAYQFSRFFIPLNRLSSSSSSSTEDYVVSDKEHYSMNINDAGMLAKHSALPALPYQPKFFLSCRHLHGPTWILRKGLMNAGLLETHNISDSNFVVACNSRTKIPLLVKHVFGLRIMSNIIGVVKSYCLGSEKSEQLACRRALAAMDGCEYNTLGIQPPQFQLPEECPTLAKLRQPVLTKPVEGLQGLGIIYHKSPPSIKRCQEEFKNHIAQAYVSNLALLNGFKFDLRTWVLVAQVDPLMVFAANGFARVAGEIFDANARDSMVHVTNAHGQNEGKGHYRSLPSIEGLLNQAYPDSFPLGYFNSSFYEKVDRATRFAVLAQFKTYFGDFTVKPRLGFFQLFGWFQLYLKEQTNPRTKTNEKSVRLDFGHSCPTASA